MNKNDGGPAFPVPYHPHQGAHLNTINGGMSKRDYFAAHAPPRPSWFRGERTTEQIDNDTSQYNFEKDTFTQWPYYYADAMVKESGK